MTNFEHTNMGISPSNLPTSLFYDHMFDNRPYIRSGNWPTQSHISDIDERPVAQAIDSRGNVEALYTPEVYEPGKNPYVLLDRSHGSVSYHICASNIDAVEPAYNWVRERMPEHNVEDTPPDIVSMTFWMMTPQGGASLYRMIDAPGYSDIKHNYSADVQEHLDSIMALEDWSPERGQMILWYGEPGTGKTFALRALARAWRDWADFKYITDPEQFFGNANYMLNVLLKDSDQDYGTQPGEVGMVVDQDQRWQVLILEDSGELMKKTGKQETGQAFSRLLNVADGIIGQGLKCLILVTTNEQVGDLHEAIARPGRGAEQTEFVPLNTEEIATWWDVQEHTPEERELHRSAATVAELYAQLRGEKNRNSKVKTGFR